MLAAVNGALNYFKFTFSRKVYVQITCYKGQRVSSKKFLDDEITFTRKFQYLRQIKNGKISPWKFQLFFVKEYLIVTYL